MMFHFSHFSAEEFLYLKVAQLETAVEPLADKEAPRVICHDMSEMLLRTSSGEGWDLGRFLT